MFEDTGDWQVSLQNGPILNMSSDIFDTLQNIRAPVDTEHARRREVAGGQQAAEQFAAEETTRRGRAGLPSAEPGMPAIDNYDDFRTMWLQSRASQMAGIGGQEPVTPALEQQIQAAWQNYLGMNIAR
jgi:predicted amidohydrolase YtcJ